MKEKNDNMAGFKKQEEIVELEDKSDEIILTRGKRCWVFAFVIIMNVICNLDNGFIPAATNDLKAVFKVGEDILGWFGSIVYFGNLLGSIILAPIINKCNRKYLLIFFLVINAACLYTFTVWTATGWGLFNRAIVGITQVYIAVYSPVWIDQYGPRIRKTNMMAMQQISSPLGTVFGYILTVGVRSDEPNPEAKYKWLNSFTIQSIMQVAVALTLLFIPKIYFEYNLFKSNKEDDAHQTAEVDMELTIFKYLSKNSEKRNFWKDFCTLMRNKLFVVSTLAACVLMFIVTAITFWISDYLTIVLKVEKNIITILFVITCVTAPTLGIIIGGCIVQKIGGYETKKSSLFILICAILSGCCSIAIPFCNGVVEFAIFLWLFLAFGGAIVPNIIGITISSLPLELRGSGNSLSSTFLNSLGFLPAPYIYGAIFEATKDINNKISLIVVLNTTWIGVILMAISMYLRYKIIDRRDSTATILAGKTYTNNKMINNFEGIGMKDINIELKEKEDDVVNIEEEVQKSEADSNDECKKDIIEISPKINISIRSSKSNYLELNSKRDSSSKSISMINNGVHNSLIVQGPNIEEMDKEDIFLKKFNTGKVKNTNEIIEYYHDIII